MSLRGDLEGKFTSPFERLLAALDRRLSGDVNISSGWRSQREQDGILARVGLGNASRRSAHTEGNAGDLPPIPGMTENEQKRFVLETAAQIGLLDRTNVLFHNRHLHIQIGTTGLQPHVVASNDRIRDQIRRNGGDQIMVADADAPADATFDANARAITNANTGGRDASGMGFIPTLGDGGDENPYVRRDAAGSVLAYAPATQGGASPFDLVDNGGRMGVQVASLDPSHVPNMNGGALKTGPSNVASERYLGLIGDNSGQLWAGEDRLAFQGETRAALFRKLVEAGGGDITLDDLKNIPSWSGDKANLRQVVDGFIADKSLDPGLIYHMLGQSDVQLAKKDPALFQGTAPNTLTEVFEKAQAVAEASAAGTAPVRDVPTIGGANATA